MTIAAILGDKGREVISVTAHQSVMEAASLLAKRRIGALPVMDGDAVVGIFSERDVIHALDVHGADALARTVGDVMTAPAITVAADHAVIAALALMTRRRIRHLPVVEGGARDRRRVDRRPRQIPNRRNRGRCGRHARLHPVGVMGG